MQVDIVGEALVEVGAPDGWGPVGLTEAGLEEVLQQLRTAAHTAGADTLTLRQRKLTISTQAKDDAGAVPVPPHSHMCTQPGM